MAYTGSSMIVMLTTIHEVPVEKASIIFITGTIGFILATPISGIVIKGKWIRRLTLTYIGYILLGSGVVFRTGEVFGAPKLSVTIIT